MRQESNETRRLQINLANNYVINLITVKSKKGWDLQLQGLLRCRGVLPGRRQRW